MVKSVVKEWKQVLLPSLLKEATMTIHYLAHLRDQ